MAELILFLIATIPVILLGKYVYNKDRNKEPSRLLLKLFLGGIMSCFLVMIIGGIISVIVPIFSEDPSKLNMFELILFAFLKVALIEETCKWIMVYFISYNSKDFDEVYDIIVYSVFVAIGFAFFENLFYVYDSGVIGGVIVGALRALLAVPGHACDGVFMGYYLGLAKLSTINNRKDLSNKYFILSIIVPILLHGFYDFCLFTGNWIFLIVFGIFIIILYVMAIKRIKKLARINKKMKYEDNYCPTCGHPVNSDFCPICGRKNN